VRYLLCATWFSLRHITETSTEHISDVIVTYGLIYVLCVSVLVVQELIIASVNNA
jgi:hypothetical protein